VFGAPGPSGATFPRLVRWAKLAPFWENAMVELRDEIAAYEAMRGDLEARFLGKWALVHDRKLIDTYNSFDDAAKEAVQRFGRGPYLIRQIGAPPITLPASVRYRPEHANYSLRIP
jgi:hypothetical protein